MGCSRKYPYLPTPFQKFQFSFTLSFKILVFETPTPLIFQWPIWGGYIFSEPHVLLLLVLLSMPAHLKLTHVHVCYAPSRRKTAWCKNAAHVRPAGRAEPSRVFTNRTTVVHLWWSCISPQNLQAPYRNAHLTAEQQSFKSSMSTVRAAVEWVLGDISTYFALLDLKKNLKIGLSPVGKLYCISALF